MYLFISATHGYLTTAHEKVTSFPLTQDNLDVLNDIHVDQLKPCNPLVHEYGERGRCVMFYIEDSRVVYNIMCEIEQRDVFYSSDFF